MIPAAIYFVMALGQQYPKTERVASNVPASEMFAQVLRPLFLLLFVCMWMTAATELGPCQWFPSVMKDLTGLQGGMFLVYAAGLMFGLRFFFSGLVHKFSPFAALTLCSALSAVGLFALGNLHAGTSVFVAFLAATVFGVGKTFFWPTMLGVTSELFPRGGALLLGLMGGAGLRSVGLVLPLTGSQVGSFGGAPALS